MRNLPVALAVIAVLSTAACGGADPHPGTDGGPPPPPAADCTLTVSGGLSGSSDCRPVTGYDNLHDTWTLSVTTSGSPSILVGLNYPGDMHTGTFTTSGTAANTAISAQPAPQGSTIEATWVAKTGSGAQGTWTLVISDTGSAITGSNGSKLYQSSHGTLDATLPPAAGTGASGNVTLHVTF